MAWKIKDILDLLTHTAVSSNMPGYTWPFLGDSDDKRRVLADWNTWNYDVKKEAHVKTHASMEE